MEFKEFKYFVQHYHITKCQNQNLNLIICDLKPFREKKKKKQTCFKIDSHRRGTGNMAE